MIFGSIFPRWEERVHSTDRDLLLWESPVLHFVLKGVRLVDILISCNREVGPFAEEV